MMSGMKICDCLWAGFMLIWLILAASTKRTAWREGVSSRLPYTVLTFAAFYAMFGGNVPEGLLRTMVFPASPLVEMLGVAITAAGLAFAVWARFYLGANWSGRVTVKVGHELIRTGPYRWVRHPIYSGMILAMLGTALNRRLAQGLFAVVLLYIGFKMKSRIEERAMRSVFGTEYDEYSRGTGAIFPRLPF
jgi:protein-S-isoprenylcysteine O-methyltransferase Ste14